MQESAEDTLRRRMRILMGSRGQAAFAEELGVDQSTISRFLSGKNRLSVKLGRALINKNSLLKPDVDAVLFPEYA